MAQPPIADTDVFLAKRGAGLPLMATTAREIKDYIGGGTDGVLISDTPPATPVAGSLWWKSDTGELFVRYEDADSAQWVALGGKPGAPGRDGRDIPSGTTAPTTPAAGNYWVDTANAGGPQLKFYDGTDWIPVGPTHEEISLSGLQWFGLALEASAAQVTVRLVAYPGIKNKVWMDWGDGSPVTSHDIVENGRVDLTHTYTPLASPPVYMVRIAARSRLIEADYNGYNLVRIGPISPGFPGIDYMNSVPWSTLAVVDDVVDGVMVFDFVELWAGLFTGPSAPITKVMPLGNSSVANGLFMNSNVAGWIDLNHDPVTQSPDFLGLRYTSMENTFSGTKLQGVNLKYIPPSCTNLGQAFAGCTNLTNLNIGQSSYSKGALSTSVMTMDRFAQGSTKLVNVNLFQSFPLCSDWTNAFYNCALSAGSVDGIIKKVSEQAVVHNGTLGLNGGTSAAPTEASADALRHLTDPVASGGLGWTVQTN